MSKPMVLSPLAPHLSERDPLIGPTRIRVTSSGMRNIPACRGSYPLTSWKYSVITNANAANASPLRRLAMLPAVNNRILNREGSSAGYRAFRSIIMKIAKHRMLVATTAWFVKAVRLPSVRPRSKSVMATENVMAPGASNFSPVAGREISFSRFRDQ